ncbi:hypothetical protein EVAR_9278_1 [Eumeta japonica]|uniref:Uncharacterized protein n=1 Tax=Eumeta variegata TaxID=151549 RepID=A0A4C1TNT6_EUMVA|nr:hypothetical protein EVAR_9278_1 [Eumeta japonica]
MEDAESRGYEVLGPDTPTHVPTDPRHRADILDIVLNHIYSMGTQHLSNLITITYVAPTWQRLETVAPQPRLSTSDCLVDTKSLETYLLSSPSKGHKAPRTGSCPHLQPKTVEENSMTPITTPPLQFDWSKINPYRGDASRDVSEPRRLRTERTGARDGDLP